MASVEAKTPKLAQRVAERIEREILDRDLSPGHRLGTEAELTRRFAVSRAALREAIRLVERRQLAETRRGNGGGLFVRQPAYDAVAHSLCAYLESIGLEIDELFEALQIVNTATVGLAARRADPAGAEALIARVEDWGPAGPPQREAARFQDFYAHASALARSPALALFVRTLHHAAEHVAFGLHYRPDEIARDQRALRRVMHRIALAIRRGQPIAAERHMATFLDRLERRFRALKPRRRRGGSGTRKRAAALAREIGEDIRRSGRRPGERLGSEPELIARFDVSRAALREAVRLLEEHGVARTRRGLHGGLIVAEPDPTRVIRSAARYLSRVDRSGEPLREARRLVDPAAAALAAERASDDERARLSQAIVERLGLEALHDRLPLRAARRAPARERPLQVARALHGRVVDLCGNAVLEIFSRVAFEADWGRGRRLAPDVAARVLDGTVRVVAAIARGDASAARQATLDRLELESGPRFRIRPRRRR